MLKQRIALLVALAIVSTVSPTVYQYVVEPRVEGAAVNIEVNTMTFDLYSSTHNITAFTLFLKISNDETSEVIVSPIDADVYYRSKIDNRYSLIGKFKTNFDYVVPGQDYIQSTSFGEFGENGDVTRKYNGAKDIYATLYLYEGSGFYEGTNEALASLINDGDIRLSLNGKSEFGPVAIDFAQTIDLELDLFSTDIVLYDLFLFADSYYVTQEDSFVLHTKMSNPSSIPFSLIIDDGLALSLYDESDTFAKADADLGRGVEGEPKQKGWGLSSKGVINTIDPDLRVEGGGFSKTFGDAAADNALLSLYNNKDDKLYSFSADEQNQDVFFGFDFTDPIKNADNTENQYMAWFLSDLISNNIASNLILKGPAKIRLGTGDLTSFTVDMKTDSRNYLEIDDVNLYQKSLTTPVSMLGDFELKQIGVEKITVDTENDQVKLDMSTKMDLTNSYRFRYDIDNFLTSYIHEVSDTVLGRSSKPAAASILPATRGPKDDQGKYTISTSATTIPLNLSITYNTNDGNAGIYHLISDLGADPDLLNITNPFYINKDTYGTEYDRNPLATMEFLLNSKKYDTEGNPLNPLTLLNEVDLYSVIKDYEPLRCEHFGTEWLDLPNTDLDAQPNTPDMPMIGQGTTRYGGSSYYVSDIPSVTNWQTDLYSDNVLEQNMVRNNTYEIIQHNYDNAYFTDDSDMTNANFNEIMGGIFQAPQLPSGANWIDNSPLTWNDALGVWVGDRQGDVETNSPHHDLIWRIYTDNSGGFTGKWGHYWGTQPQGNGNRGYYFVMNLPSGNSVMASQNFTLDPSKFTNGAADIESVTLSLNYRYTNGGYSNSDASLMFAWYNTVNNQYDYKKYGTSSAYSNRLGIPISNPGDGEWTHYTMDLTDAFKERVANYTSTSNQEYLKGEIGFAGWADSGSTLQVYFDDLVLNIKYRDHSANLTGELSMLDLFQYLEEQDPQKGNFFNMMSRFARQGYISGHEFMAFLANEQTEPRSEGTGMEFFDFLQFANVSLSQITELMSENFPDLGVGEKINFLDMLTHSKYKVARPNDDDPDYVTPEPAKYGPRILNPDSEYWTIEDPYYASRALTTMLYQNFFDHAAGGLDIHLEQELWYMLENLGISPKWVLLYLLTHGWTKSDVFDLLESLGFAQETKTDFATDRSWGRLTAQIDIKAEINAGIFGGWLTAYEERNTFDYDMAQIMQDGVQQFFDALCAYYSNNDPALRGRKIVDNTGYPENPQYVWFPGYRQGDFLDICIGTRPVYFRLHMRIHPTTGVLAQAPNLGQSAADETFYPDYLSTNPSYPGFLDAGTQQLASNIRMNFKYGGETFITQGGDPVSLFSFLDDYFFGIANNYNYSSMTMLNFFDVSGRDFVDIITGYDNATGKHDVNGNGRADDWTAPAEYGTGQRASLQGWGTSFQDNRLFYATDGGRHDSQTEGKIIWSDSPDFAADSATHRAGNVEKDDNIREGAPPIVDLIDMLTWISETANKPDPNTLIKWLLGELPSSKYSVLDPRHGYGMVSSSKYNQGMSNQEVWRMLKDATLNSTGFFTWLEKDKGVETFNFLYQLNKTTGIITPLNLLFFAVSPNMLQLSDGMLSFMYHDALHPSSTDAAENFLWSFFNSKNFSLDAVSVFFEYLNSSGYPIFDLFMALQVDIASWINVLNNKYGIEPIELLKRMKKLNWEQPQYLVLDPYGTSVFTVKANMTLKYEGITLNLQQNQPIKSNVTLTSTNHFSDFLDSDYLVGNRFIVN